MEQRATVLSEQMASLEPAQGVQTVYRRLFGRDPDERELQFGLAFLRPSEGETEGATSTAISAARWQDYCQALFSVNEFHFVD
jgi:hypothetical protein